jgi:hypothetical protein
MFGLMGICQLKNSTSYTWLFGLIKRKEASLCIGFLNFYDAFSVSVICFYFIFVSKDWFPLMLTTTCLGAAG